MFQPHAAKTMAVFSHPNHELSVLMTLARLEPLIVFLTDGGSEQRMDESKAALSRVGLYPKARFLKHTEASFYQAILRKDARFFVAIANHLRDYIALHKPVQILTDAVEFYNPVHDIAFPIVQKAVGGSEIPVYEVPLVYERQGTPDSYVLQDVPREAPIDSERVEVILDGDETQTKTLAYLGDYGIIRNSMNPLVVQNPHVFRREVLVGARKPSCASFTYYGRRYDRRGQEGVQAGTYEKAILSGDHYAETITRIAEVGR
jgi:hypothetical protein